MMAKTKTAADNLCERLIQWGADRGSGRAKEGVRGMVREFVHPEKG